MLNEKELQAATVCEGNCTTCDMDVACDIEFGCTKFLARETLDLLHENKKLQQIVYIVQQTTDTNLELAEENRKLRILCRNLECCSCCKNRKNKKICKDCSDSGVNLKNWEFDEKLLDKIV